MSGAEGAKSSSLVRGAIMQPAFLPWIGYFALMDSVDIFVFLDDVQFDKRSWQQRNRIKTAQGPLWLTVPVFSKGRFDQPINAVQCRRDGEFPVKVIRSIEHAYRKAPYFDDVFPAIREHIERQEPSLACLNISLLDWFRGALGLGAAVRRASDLGVEGRKAERLREICVALGIGHYISPSGAREYLGEGEDLARSGIALSYLTYEHPRYDQLHGAFEPHMSALDLVMNMGPKAADIMRKGLPR